MTGPETRPDRPASSVLAGLCQGLDAAASGFVEAEAETHGQHAGMGSHHEGDQHFSLIQGGDHERRVISDNGHHC